MILVDAVDMTLEQRSEENPARRQERVAEEEFQLERGIRNLVQEGLEDPGEFVLECDV